MPSRPHAPVGPSGSGEAPSGRSLLERFLNLFTEVRSGEATTALLLMVNIFLILTAYYFIKPVREALILQGGSVQILGWTVGKAELKSYASAGMAALLILVIRFYGRLASAVRREQLITFVTLFFISNLVVFYLLAVSTPSPWLGVAFFLWVGIFNVMVVAQFWSFANDVYLPDEGRRLFPLVAFGGSAGAVAGSAIAGVAIKKLGVNAMLPATGIILGVCILLTRVVHRREVMRHGAVSGARGTAPTARAPQEADESGPVSKEGGFQLILRNRYLLGIAMLMLFANLVNTTGEFILSKKVAQAAAAAVGSAGGEEEGKFIGQFYAGFYLAVNSLSLVMQLFLVSRLLKYFGVKIALMMLPAIALGGYAVLAFGAALGTVRLIKVLENSTDYSVQQTTRHALFLPTSRVAKYKAKAATDTFFQRFGDFGSALLVLLGTQLAFTVEKFAAVNVILVGVWIAIAVATGRGFSQLMATRKAALPEAVAQGARA